VLFVSCIFWGFLLVGAWAHQQDGWAVRGPWKRRTDAFSLGGEFTWKMEKGSRELQTLTSQIQISSFIIFLFSMQHNVRDVRHQKPT
jgi:hypothetical protein